MKNNKKKTSIVVYGKRRDWIEFKTFSHVKRKVAVVVKKKIFAKH